MRLYFIRNEVALKFFNWVKEIVPLLLGLTRCFIKYFDF